MTRLSASAAPAFLALACVGFIASAPAHATGPEPGDAANDDQDRRGDIVVTGQHQDELQGPKATARVVDTPRSVVVLPKDVIEQTGSTTLAEALRTVPGITFGAAEGGNPIGDRPFIRGFDSQGSTFVDGVRDPASQTREIFDVDQVQIVRGSDSTLGGRGSAGGSINVISKLPVAHDFVSATASYGTADYKRVTADVNEHLSETTAVRLAALWHDQDVAGRDAIWQKRWGVAPSFTIGLGTPTRLTASYYYLESHELPDSGLPYLYTIGNAPAGVTHTTPVLDRVTTISGASGVVDRSTFYGLANRDFRDSTTDQATLRAEHDFGGVTLRNTARWSRNTQEYSFLLPDDSQGNVFGTNAASPTTAGGLVWRRANTRYGYSDSLVDQTDLFGSFDTGKIHHSFAAGAEISWEKARRGALVTRGYLNGSGVEQLSTGSTISPRCNPAAIARYYCTSLFNPNPNDSWTNYASDTSTTPAAIVHMLPIEETQNDASTVSIYGFDSIAIVPQLILNIGARYDRFKSTLTPGQGYAATSTVRLSRTDRLFNWQAGLVFKPTADTSIYASYATAATPPNSLLGEGREDNALPTSATAANLALLDSLKVQKTRSYEIGAKGDLFNGRLALAAALFQTDIDNARVTSDVNTVAFIGKTRIRGFELTANGVILPGWTVFGGYTRLDPRIVDGGYTALAVAANGPAAATTVQVPSVNTGKQVPQTAKDSFTLWTTVEPVKGFTIGGGAFYSSRIFGGYADNRSASQTAAGVVTVTPATKLLYREVPAYWRFDARIGYRINPHWEVSVNVQNVTDKAYFNQVYTSHYASIAPGRSAFATLSFKY